MYFQLKYNYFIFQILLKTSSVFLFVRLFLLILFSNFPRYLQNDFLEK